MSRCSCGLSGVPKAKARPKGPQPAAMICFRPPADSPLIGSTMSDANQVAAAMSYLADSAVEEIHVAGLNGRNVVLGDYMVCRGWTGGCNAPPEEIIRAVLLMGASRFILIHNHPAGAEFSPEDYHYTEMVLAASACSGVKMLDHVLVLHGGGGVSMRAFRGDMDWEGRLSRARSGR